MHAARAKTESNDDSLLPKQLIDCFAHKQLPSVLSSGTHRSANRLRTAQPTAGFPISIIPAANAFVKCFFDIWVSYISIICISNCPSALSPAVYGTSPCNFPCASLKADPFSCADSFDSPKASTAVRHRPEPSEKSLQRFLFLPDTPFSCSIILHPARSVPHFTLTLFQALISRFSGKHIRPPPH